MLFKNFTIENSHLIFWENMSTLNEFIGYVGLTDFCSEIWSKKQ